MGTEFSHLGLDFNLQPYSAIATITIDTRMRLGISTICGLMGADRINGLNPKIPLHIYKIFVLARIQYGLEAININPTVIEMAHMAMIRNTHGLPQRTAIPALYIFSAMLPMMPC